MRNIFSIAIFLFILFSCSQSYTPKPRGYLRIEQPATHYIMFDEASLPYAFSVSGQAIIELPPVDSAAGWLNMDYPVFQAKIYCSYKAITTQTLHEHTADCHQLAERAARNAEAITEVSFENQESRVFGTLFLIEGESASPIQFMLTDSTSHFFRGALYYKYKPNMDSIAPITAYIKDDITELIQTFHWKK